MVIIELVRAITGTIMHGFQNNFAQLLSSRRRNAGRNICLSRLKVKVTLDVVMLLFYVQGKHLRSFRDGVTLEGQMIKWS